jgi:hypothetical protein
MDVPWRAAGPSGPSMLAKAPARTATMLLVSRAGCTARTGPSISAIATSSEPSPVSMSGGSPTIASSSMSGEGDMAASGAMEDIWERY